MIGSIGITITSEYDFKGELGYKIGSHWWNQGYASEAAEAVIDYMFHNKSNSIRVFLFNNQGRENQHFPISPSSPQNKNSNLRPDLPSAKYDHPFRRRLRRNASCRHTVKNKKYMIGRIASVYLAVRRLNHCTSSYV